jgi:ABC-type branched-subunit amino acid transport system ATPase component/ABC-type branched-subunit amino acid transport system permease subunit
MGSDYWSAVIVMAGIYMLLAMGLNVVVGYSGLLDLGYAGFWAVGAYTTAIVTGKAPFHPLELDFWASIPFAILAAVGSGLLLGLVTLRVRGDYLAIVTLGFGEIVRIIANSWDSVTNGPSGITDIAHPELFGFNFGLDPTHYVLLIWVFIGSLYFLISNLWESRIGRAWYATRQDEDAAEILGVPTFRMKLLAFAIGASTAGLAGAVYGAYVGYIVPSNFVLLTAIMILAAVVLGGMSNMKGAMLGAAIIVFLPETFRGLEQSRFLVFGLILILMMIVRPAGLFPLQPKQYRLPSSSGSSPFSPIAWWQKKEGGGVGSITTNNIVQVPAILRCEGLTKQFGGVLAVDQVSLTISEGSIFAVIGPNGAGKSTLFNMISGSVKPDQGKVEFAGQSMVGLKPHSIAASGVARTFQLIRLFSAATVAENVLIGADLRNAGSTIGTALGLPASRKENGKALAVAEAALSFCGIRQLAGAIAGTLSYGDQRRTEIARALATSPRILLLDEPAAGMNPTERRRLGELICNIRDSGITVVIVEHDMNLVMEISDEILVLDSGRILALGSPEVVRGDPKVIEAYLGRQQDTPFVPGKILAAVRTERGADKKPLALKIRDLKVAYGLIEAVHHLDLEIEQGEIVSLIGANGAGKTSTLLAISGVHRASGGTILLNGEHIERWPAHRVAAAGVAHVPEGRRIFPRMTVWENLAMGGYATHMVPGDADLERIFTLFPILRHRLGQQGGTLSGGEQQMLAMARAMVSKPNLLLLDEPSMGLAPQLVQLVFGLITEINGSGVSILLVEQNAEMALMVSNRAYVLEAGTVRLSGAAAALLNNKEIQAAYLGG